jgi:8-amino-7-oxononanoate synthase
MFHEKLKILKEKRLLRDIKDRTSPQGPKIKIGGKEYINFSSNDYLGLSDNYGYGPASSRLLSGGSILHKKLEDELAKFKDTESALVFNSGYSANIGIIPAISDKNSVILSDELNHASIIDGCRLSKAKTIIYRHKDLSHLEDLIKKEHANSKIVMTDTVFSMDGDIAPLNDIYNICMENNVILYIDDAHGTGVLGNGRGALSHFDIKPVSWIIQMGTLSKALGSFGAFVTGSKDVIEWILNTARSFIFSTALPSCVVAASLAALELIEEDPELIKRLWTNRQKLVKYIKDINLNITESETPILALKTGNVKNTLRISRYLIEKGIFVPAIRPPTVMEPRLRISVTASHTDDDIERLIRALRDS